MRHSYAKSLEPGDVIITQVPAALSLSACDVSACVVLCVTPRLAYAGDETLQITCIALSGEITALKRHATEYVCVLRRGML